MADDNTLQILVEVKSKLDDLDKAIAGLNKLKETATSVSTGSAAAIGGFTAVFEKLGEVAERVGKVVLDTLISIGKESIKTAADIQTSQSAITTLLQDHGKVANEVLGGVNSLWQQIGVQSAEALGNATKALSAANVPIANIVPRLIELSKISSGAELSLETVSAAYIRLRQSIENGTPPMVRGFGEMGQATKIMMEEMARHFNTNASVIREMIKSGQLSLNDLNKALRESATEGGRFANAFVEKKLEFNGAVQAMKTAWQGFLLEIGRPLIDVLTPVINKITEIGKAFTKVAADEGWQTAMKLAWSILLDEIIQTIVTIFVDTFVRLGPATAVAFWRGFIEETKSNWNAVISGNIGQLMRNMFLGEAFLKGVGKGIADQVLGPLTPEMEKKKAELEKMLADILKPGGGPKPTDVRLPPETPEETHRVQTARDLKAALQELEGVMEHIKAEQELIAKAPFMGIDQKQELLIVTTRREIAVLGQELQKLQAQKFTLGLNPAQIAEVDKDIQKTTDKIKGLQLEMLKLTHSMQANLQQWVNSWGDVGTQIAQTIEGTITSALEEMNNWIVTGKFNAQQLLQSIVRLGLQLLEHLALQQVITAMNAKLAAAQAAILGPTIASEMAAAATAMTIATQGEAAAQAPFSIAAALAAVKAVLGLGGTTMHEGGVVARRFHNGGDLGALEPDEVPIIAQTGEIIINRRASMRHRDFLLGLNEASVSMDNYTFGHGETRHGRGRGGGGASFGGGGGSFGVIGVSGFGSQTGTGGTAGSGNLYGRLYMKHRGGEIGRYHNGGMVGGSRLAGGGIHIYAFTDLKALTQHMASRDGQKIIFDTIRGNRINLGL